MLQVLKIKAISMLTEAVFDGSQAVRDPVGGSVEFHFVPILKLISTLLIMGIFEDEDVKHVLKMIDPSVFNGKEAQAAEEEEGEKGEEEEAAAEEEEGEAKGLEGEQEDEGVGEEEEEDELKALKSETEDVEEEDGEKEGGEITAEEKERESGPKEDEVKEEEEAPEEGLLQMKLPESVKLQVGL